MSQFLVPQRATPLKSVTKVANTGKRYFSSFISATFEIPAARLPPWLSLLLLFWAREPFQVIATLILFELHVFISHLKDFHVIGQLDAFLVVHFQVTWRTFTIFTRLSSTLAVQRSFTLFSKHLANCLGRFFGLNSLEPMIGNLKKQVADQMSGNVYMHASVVEDECSKVKCELMEAGKQIKCSLISVHPAG